MQSKIIKRSTLISICAALFVNLAIAMPVEKTTFDITSKIYVDGALISSPRITAHPNQKASIFISDRMTTKKNQISMSGHSLKLALVARNNTTAGKNDSIRVSYDIRYQNGKIKMHCKPTIILRPNQGGLIGFSENGHAYEMHVLAQRQS
ncbi:MAG: hypothetical protein SFW66_00070 [Gammaproteobacteria bacterium]|nr:hypothetical protein [Gammaproteobacteria bacterium]